MWSTLRVVTGCLLVLAGASARAENLVSVESRTVLPGSSGQVVGVYFEQSQSIRGFGIGLEIRSVSGNAGPAAVSLSFDGRMDSLLTQIQVAGQYKYKTEPCRNGTISYNVPEATGTDTTVAVTALPWGLLFAAQGWPSTEYLPSGTDAEPSLTITMDILDSVGTFEIDTVCVSKGTVLQWITGTTPATALVPAFQKAIVTVAECQCTYHGDIDASAAIDAVDVALLIDWVYFSAGQPAKDTTCPHLDRGDVNCDGVDDALDVTLLVDYVNFGGDPPCDPCDCSPYPTSCP